VIFDVNVDAKGAILACDEDFGVVGCHALAIQQIHGVILLGGLGCKVVGNSDNDGKGYDNDYEGDEYWKLVAFFIA
jgi:hypothetical protein